MIDGDGRVIQEIVLPQTRDRVFDFLVDAEMLARWLGTGAELDPNPGGILRFEVAPGQFCEGRYVEVDRPRRVAFSWGWSDPWWDVPPGASPDADPAERKRTLDQGTTP
jgi:uncharacterized protein YndB with AHSA1/START domain